MGSWGVCDEEGWRKGPWTPQEDEMLIEYVSNYGEGRWSSVSKCTGLRRSGKSCRLRWVNYLRPGLKKGHLTPQEEGIIIELHALWGNKWSTIARYLPGRTDNEIKNYWRTHFKKRSPPPSSNPNNTNKKRKLVLPVEKEEKQEDNSNTTDHNLDNQASGITYTSNDNRDLEMIVPADYDQEGISWFDYSVPVDCLMWDGLWNLEDGCTRMGGENEASFVGNGTYIF